MVFGRNETFDVDRVIDLFQALESFDSLGFIVAAGSKGAVEGGGGGVRDEEQARREAQQQQTRAALTFFFSPEGGIVRELLLEEVVKSLDALSRDALYSLALTLNIKRLPRILQAAAPKISEQDRVVLDNIRKLISFFFINGASEGPSSSAASLVSSLLLGQKNTSPTDLLGISTQRLLELRRITREFGPAMTSFGLLIASRVVERVVSRTMVYVGHLIFRD